VETIRDILHSLTPRKSNRLVFETNNSMSGRKRSRVCCGGPLDYFGFQKRVSSFSAATWFSKPYEVNAMVCSWFGFQNTGADVIYCVDCGACLIFKSNMKKSLHVLGELVSTFLKKLKDSHRVDCSFHYSRCPLKYLYPFGYYYNSGGHFGPLLDSILKASCPVDEEVNNKQRMEEQKSLFHERLSCYKKLLPKLDLLKFHEDFIEKTMVPYQLTEWLLLWRSLSPSESGLESSLIMSLFCWDPTTEMTTSLGATNNSVVLQCAHCCSKVKFRRPKK